MPAPLRLLTTRLTLAILLMLVAGTWGLSAHLTHILREDMVDLVKAQQLSTATTVAADISHELEDRLRALETVSATIPPALLADPRALQSLLEQRPLLLSFFNAGAFVMRADGVAIAEIPRSADRVGVNFSERGYARGTLRDGRPTIAPPFVGQAHKSPLIVMAVPIRDAGGRVIGALAGSTDLMRPNFLDTFVANGYGKTGGYRLIARNERLVVTASDKQRILQPLPEPGRVPVIDRFVAGEEGIELVSDPEEGGMLVAVKSVPVANWHLAVVLPTAEALAPLAKVQKQVLRAVFLLALVGGVLAFWLLKHQLAPLQTAAQRISRMAGDPELPMRPLPVERNDEVGQLVASFNGLTAAFARRGDDVLAQKRRAEALLELPRLADRHDERRFMQMGLEVAEDLTGSQISFIHFVNPDEETIELVTWSQRTLERYCHASFDSHYPVPQAGIWADALRERRPVVFNDYLACPHKHGLPEGHAALARLISVPVFEEGRVVMLAGVGNKAEDYQLFDVNTVQLIANEIWHLVQRRRALTEIRQLNATLEERVQARTAALQLANRELNEAREAAETANRAKTTFLANMSHELRTPLSAIIGLTELAMMRVTEPKPREQLGKVMRASDHLLEIINKVLDLSKIESERLVLDQTEFCFDEITGNLANLYGPQARQKGLTLTIGASPELAGLNLLGDPTRLNQILYNLVGNAIKFTEHGEVRVKVTHEPGEGDAVMLRFDVADTGAGIDAEDRLRIFNAFEQADASPLRRFGGSGLGLTISRRLARLMGGDIDVDSTPGEGSRFRFTVQLRRSGQPAGELAGPESRSSAQLLRERFAGARVLVAEDDEASQEMVSQCLEEVGMAVTLAPDGAAAIEAARNADFDLILMDVQMPRLSGIDATRVIRGDSRNRNTPILALTANAFAEDQERCIRAGMDGHVGKPFKTLHLYDQMLRWLGRKPDTATPAG